MNLELVEPPEEVDDGVVSDDGEAEPLALLV